MLQNQTHPDFTLEVNLCAKVFFFFFTIAKVFIENFNLKNFILAFSYQKISNKKVSQPKKESKDFLAKFLVVMITNPTFSCVSQLGLLLSVHG